MKTCKQCGKLRDESMVCKCCAICIECNRDHFADVEQAERNKKKPTAQGQTSAAVAQG